MKLKQSEWTQLQALLAQLILCAEIYYFFFIHKGDPEAAVRVLQNYHIFLFGVVVIFLGLCILDLWIGELITDLSGMNFRTLLKAYLGAMTIQAWYYLFLNSVLLPQNTLPKEWAFDTAQSLIFGLGSLPMPILGLMWYLSSFSDNDTSSE